MEDHVVTSDMSCVVDVAQIRRQANVAEDAKSRAIADRRHRCLRYHLYKTHVTILQDAGVLQRGRGRIPLPGCVEASIRAMYPSLEGTYTGFAVK